MADFGANNFVQIIFLGFPLTFIQTDQIHFWVCQYGNNEYVLGKSSTSSNIFSYESSGPVEAKFHMKPHLYGGTKVCSEGPGHLTIIVTTLIYV